jgi:colanic acid biosynthesis glycosyl transferase WcaI
MEATFGMGTAGLLATRLARDWDLILYVGAQPAIAMTARWTARLLRIPYAINIQDMAAQAAADVGIVKMPGLARVLSAFERRSYRGAAGAMVLCDAFQEQLVADGYPAGQIRLIRSPVDVERVRPVPPDPAFRRRLGLNDSDFVLLFAGSMGLKQGLTNVVEAARLLTETHPSVKWILVGDGEAAARLRELVQQYALERYVHFLPLQLEAMLSTMFAAADVLLLNQVSAVKDTVIPSKLLTYMAAGKPVLAAVNAMSQGAQILRQAGGGLIIDPDDPASLAAGVRRIMEDPARPEMGKRNREYAELHFDSRRIVEAQEEFLLGMLNGNRSRLK